MSTKKNIRDTLLDGLEQLVRDGSTKTFWSSTRATADSIIALNLCLPSTEFTSIKGSSLKFLLNEAKPSNHTLNWNEEIWDTSIAAMALAHEPVKYSTELTKASNWIKAKYLPTHTSWNEEVWETLLALNSITYLKKNLPSIYNPDDDFTGALEWLLKIVDTPKAGILINWSSTALFIILVNSQDQVSIPKDLNRRLIEASNKCAKTICDAEILENDDLLWTPEAWSNGLVLWALSIARPGVLSIEKSFKIAKWFKTRIGVKDLPGEDRAFSCIGLYKYLEFIEAHEALGLTNEAVHQDRVTSEFEMLQEKLQYRIASNLRLRISDFQSAPPFITRNSFTGYYSVNIKSILVNVILILGTTFLLSYLTWRSQNAKDEAMKWVIIIPIVLGTLATLAQLANFTLLPKSNGSKIDSNIYKDEE